MDRDEVRAGLLRVLGEEAAAVRFKDALADALHARDAEIPGGTLPDAIVTLEGECQCAAEDIRDYLEALRGLQHVEVAHKALNDAIASAGGKDTGEGRRLYRELERLANRIREAERRKGELEVGAEATLDRLAVLRLAQRKIAGDHG